MTHNQELSLSSLPFEYYSKIYWINQGPAFLGTENWRSKTTNFRFDP